MKLLKQSPAGWQYQLNRQETEILVDLVKRFPFTEAAPVKMSRTDEAPAVLEREKLLNESLAEHRAHLQKLALNLLAADKLKRTETGGGILTLKSESREILLQILNDIRVGCWHALGEPESMTPPMAHPSAQALAYRNLMDLAGYFEQSLLEPDDLES